MTPAAAAGRAGPRHPRTFAALVGALALLAWLVLWGWSRSPYAAWLGHGDWSAAAGPAAALCRVVPGGTWLVPAVFSTAGWVLMTAAMMLPTTLPLVDGFDWMTRQRRDRAGLVGLVVLGYVAAWGALGLAAHALHAALVGFVAGSPALAWHARWIGIGIIALAGAFQFSALKQRCLEKCRSPRSFLIEHWHGRAPRREAFALGAHHGLYCVGCCWALMALMFAVGAGSLGWMLGLGAAMAIEKNLPGGRRLSAPLGVALLLWAVLEAARAVQATG
jgi:predicted metal-binding membrane protein